MNYHSTDKPYPRGEILVKGNNVFREYYLEPEITQKTLQDGWCLTGDVGYWDEQGRLVIIDRVKKYNKLNYSIFKIPQGEYISPEK
jgi:long-chain acyl-CoA synthetase